MSESEKTPTSNQDGVISTSYTLKDLTEDELKIYLDKVESFHSIRIAAPTRMILHNIINSRKSNC
jgi:hypothetical protein